mgnify:CR=1 FL=1
MDSPASPRPRQVDIAFWLLVAGCVLLMVGGLLAATMSFEAVRGAVPASMSDDEVRRFLNVHRASGAFCVLAGIGLGFLAGRMRTGDARYRRAAIGLALATVVLVSLVAVFVGIHIVALVGLLPVIGGAAALTRPAATAWFAGESR